MLLALDTSTRTVGLALYDGVEVIGELSWTSRNHHTVELAPAVVDLLKRCGATVADLTALGVALGPGSFTGLRIGLALAKGIAIARRLPIIGVPSLDALAAAQAIRPFPMAAALRAGRGRLAVGWYLPAGETWAFSGKIETLTAPEISQRIQTPTLVCGELNEEERRLLARKRRNVILASPAQALRRPAFLAELAWERLQAGKIDDPATIAPVYLHYNEPIPG